MLERVVEHDPRDQTPKVPPHTHTLVVGVGPRGRMAALCPSVDPKEVGRYMAPLREFVRSCSKIGSEVTWHAFTTNATSVPLALSLAERQLPR